MEPKNSDLKLQCLAIGSLPHKNAQEAMNLVKEFFKEIPFCPQLAKVNKNEDMIIQYLENMPSFFNDNGNILLETESEKFFQDLEEFCIDYENIITDPQKHVPDKYRISTNNSCAFPEFLNIIKETKPDYAKAQIVGPFTLSCSLNDSQGKSAIYDETLREIIIKTLIIKALWQIDKIKSANKTTKPIIFIDEPTISQLGTSAYITITETEVIEMLKEIVSAIKSAGAVSAIHCCGKCDWRIPLETGVDIINLDAFCYAQNLSLFAKDVDKFLQNGGKIAWGVVPTLDAEVLANADLESLTEVFNKAVKYLTNKGINEKLITDNSLITPSCGAGSLSEELARKAMSLTGELSKKLRERYSI